MSTVTLSYSKLEDTAEQAKKANDKIGDYIDELKDKVTNKIDKLPGSDTLGYASAASAAISSKISELVEKQKKLTNYKNYIDDLITETETRDRTVSNDMAKTADAKIGKRKWHEKIGDALFSFFCVERSDTTELGRVLTSVRRKAREKVSYFFEKTYDWFKHGDGQYVWNIIKSVGATIAAVAAAATALGAAIATGGAALPIFLAAVGAAASLVSATITLMNSSTSVYNNFKALKLSLEGNPAAARYYGNIEGVSDYVKKTDMGDRALNETYANEAKYLDETKAAADTISTVVNIAQLGNVYDYRYNSDNINGHIDSYSFSKENIRKNLNHQAGYRYKTIDGKTVYQLDPKEAFNLKSIVKPEKIIKNTTKVVESVDGLHGYLTSDNPTYEDMVGAYEDAFDIVGLVNVYDTPMKFTYKVYDAGVKLFEAFA